MALKKLKVNIGSVVVSNIDHTGLADLARPSRQLALS